MAHKDAIPAAGDGGDRQANSVGNGKQPANTPNNPDKQRPDRRVVAEPLIALLAERFPNAFVVYGPRRKPLKVGIYKDLLAALDGAVTPAELSIALAFYVGNVGYLRSMRVGAWRVDLDGKPMAAVTPEDQKHATARLVGRRLRTPPAPPPAPTKRLSLEDLRAAGARRRQGNTP
jgi:sRNA-binding protein